MERLNLKLVCEPLFNDNALVKKGYSETTLVESGFFEKEIRICIPLGTSEAYQQRDINALRLIGEYIHEKPPFLTSVRFTTLTGEEPSYIQITPALQKEDEKVWSIVYKLWPGLLRNLIGEGKVCYISGWVLLQRDLPKQLPKHYDGKIIQRGQTPDVPVLIECTSNFIALGEQNLRQGIMGSNVWHYGTWGYIIPKQLEAKLNKWASTTECTKEIVMDFFETIECVFWVQYELEGIWVMSHKLDPKAVCQRLEVDKLNRSRDWWGGLES